MVAITAACIVVAGIIMAGLAVAGTITAGAAAADIVTTGNAIGGRSKRPPISFTMRCCAAPAREERQRVVVTCCVRIQSANVVPRQDFVWLRNAESHFA